jgi:hypothetical protein
VDSVRKERLSTAHLIHDAGIIAGALQRLNKDPLPRALSLKKKVDSGETLNDLDPNFPGRACNDAMDMTGMVGRHQVCQDLISKMIGLCDGIRKKATENEKANRS